MIRACFLLVLVVLLVAAARSFLPSETETPIVGSGAALAFGFVLLASLQSGAIFGGMKLPQLTGYLVCGFLAGPSVLNFVTHRMLDDMRLVNNVAIGLIALSAGGELNFRRLRPKMRAILATSSFALVAAVLLIGSAVMAIAMFTHFLPFTEGMTVGQKAMVALTMGVVLSALSPTVTLALLGETGAAGPISETILGLVVFADLFIVFAFAGVHALANMVFPVVGATAGGMAGEVVLHIFVSPLVGLALGAVLAVYIKRVNVRVALFVFAICFLGAEAGKRLHLDPLLMCLAAGLFIENLTDIPGARLVKDIEAAAVPVFAIFFAVAGAGLELHVFTATVAATSVILVIVRAISMVIGSQIGMSVGRVPMDQRKTIPYGLLSQSGIAIGLALLVKNHFPVWGDGASACLLGAVMINELVGPVMFRRALLNSGEAGKKEIVVGAH